MQARVGLQLRLPPRHLPQLQQQEEEQQAEQQQWMQAQGQEKGQERLIPHQWQQKLWALKWSQQMIMSCVPVGATLPILQHPCPHSSRQGHPSNRMEESIICQQGGSSSSSSSTLRPCITPLPPPPCAMPCSRRWLRRS